MPSDFSISSANAAEIRFELGPAVDRQRAAFGLQTVRRGDAGPEAARRAQEQWEQLTPARRDAPDGEHLWFPIRADWPHCLATPPKFEAPRSRTRGPKRSAQARTSFPYAGHAGKHSWIVAASLRPSLIGQRDVMMEFVQENHQEAGFRAVDAWCRTGFKALIGLPSSIVPMSQRNPGLARAHCVLALAIVRRESGVRWTFKYFAESRTRTKRCGPRRHGAFGE